MKKLILFLLTIFCFQAGSLLAMKNDAEGRKKLGEELYNKIKALSVNIPEVADLVGRGANVNFVAPGTKRTPLIEATIGNMPDVVSYLLAHRAIVDAEDVNAYTALSYATALNYKNIMEILIRARANINHITRDGYTILHTMISAEAAREHFSPPDAHEIQKKIDVIKLLLAKGANVKIRVIKTQSTPELRGNLLPSELAVADNAKGAILLPYLSENDLMQTRRYAHQNRADNAATQVLATYTTYREVRPIFTTLLSMQKRLGPSVGRDLTKTKIAPELISDLTEKKLYGVKMLSPGGISDDMLRKQIRTSIYEALNRYSPKEAIQEAPELMDTSE